jgi:glycosyltransferase involved in cell wall biosynthesis
MSTDIDRRLRVCFVVPSLAGGGAERVAVQVLNALDAKRWDRSMFLFEKSGPYLADLSPSIRLEAALGSSRLERWNALRRFIRRARPNVIVAFLSYLSVLTAARAAAVGAKVVFAVGTPMSSFLADADYRWSRPWNRWLLSTAMRIGCTVTDLVLATSQGVADDLIASFRGQSARVRVVNNPVDLAAVAAAAGEPLDAHDAAQWHRPVVVAAGRLADVKNYPLLIDAFAILRQRTPASLFVLGEGDREPALRQRIHERGLDDCVHLCGFRANPWSYIARADVFALTSRYEGFGNVIVEAMA